MCTLCRAASEPAVSPGTADPAPWAVPCPPARPHHALLSVLQMVCERADAFASACALARAFPLFTHRSGASRRTEKKTVTVEFFLVGQDNGPVEVSTLQVGAWMFSGVSGQLGGMSGAALSLLGEDGRAAVLPEEAFASRLRAPSPSGWSVFRMWVCAARVY